MKRESMKKQEGKARRWWGRLGAVVVLAVLFGLMEMAGSGAMAVTTQEIGLEMPGLAAGGVLKADSGPPEGLSTADWAQIQDLIKQDTYRVIQQEAKGRAPAFEARNAGHHLRTLFDRDAVRVTRLGEDKPAWEWGMELRRFGYKGAMRTVEKAERVADGNRMEYRRGDLVEWYINDGRGLEQGFTIAAPPGKQGNDPLSVELGLTGSLLASAGKDGNAVLFEDAGGETVLRYSGLLAWDANGRDLPARMAVSDGRLTIEVDDRAAVYPVTIDPVLTEDAKLTAGDDAAAYDYFGCSVSVSGDTAVVGAYGDDDGGPLSGSAYVFVKSGEPATWNQEAKLLASDATKWDYFGYSVSVSGDTVVVGAYADDDNGLDSGSAYVFVRSGEPATWNQQTKLLASDAAEWDYFGYSVSVSGDTAVVGAYGDDDDGGGGSNSGSAYVFVRSGEPATWNQQTKLLAGDAANGDKFGVSVSVSGDTVVVGAYGDDDGGSDSGSAYVFVKGDTTDWGQQAKLLAGDAANGDKFGYSVSVSGDTAVVGAYGDSDDGPLFGSAYVFVKSGEPATWNQQAKLLASDGATYDAFGRSVSVSGDTAVVGADGDSDNGPLSGSAYVFVKSGEPATWNQQAKLLASDGAAFDEFGGSVSVCGGTVVVGALYDDDGGSNSGSAYVFNINQPPDVGEITAPLDPVAVGTEINAGADFTDPDTGDTHTAEWDWGDNTTSDGVVDQTNYSVTGAHTYTLPGVYTVTLTVTDEADESDSNVFEYVVVYDSDGGFVTGGGWIDSPEGAYAPEPSLTGKANFGFVSKYQQGATVPTGQTQFRFRVADLTFHSDTYQWLVVAGHQAKFKGDGAINGAGDYGFMITAVDEALTPSADVDLFRIKIWDKNNDEVVYDNQMGDSEDDDPTTEIGGGSIVIHDN